MHHFDATLDVQETDGGEDESSDKDDESNSESSPADEHDETKNTRAVLDLITEVNASRLEGPQS